MSPRRSPQRLDRPNGRRTPRKRVLIVCEGQVTEVEYIEGIRDHFRSLPVEIRNCKVIGLGRDPGSLVAYAVRERDKKDKEARTQRDANLACDEVWCVADEDDHETLGRALSAACKGGVNFVISRPCFDLWLLYHFEGCTAPCDPSQILRRLSKHIKGYDKHVGRDLKGGNPSTNAWLLVDVIRRSGQRSR